jgi:hypothetical protein
MNEGAAYGTYWAPVINVARDPRWGRNLEAAGEDPFLTGQYAISFVTGFQSAPEAPELLQASACCKHFVANELEAWNNTDRYHFDANVTAQDLADTCVAQSPVQAPRPPITNTTFPYHIHHFPLSHTPLSLITFTAFCRRAGAPGICRRLRTA